MRCKSATKFSMKMTWRQGVVSKYSTGGHVNHSYADQVSILKFIERNWKFGTVTTSRSRDNFPNPGGTAMICLGLTPLALSMRHHDERSINYSRWEQQRRKDPVPQLVRRSSPLPTTDNAIFPPQNLIPRFGGNTLKSVSRAFQLGITLQMVENKSVENLAEREGFEPSVQVLARTTV